MASIAGLNRCPPLASIDDLTEMPDPIPSYRQVEIQKLFSKPTTPSFQRTAKLQNFDALKGVGLIFTKVLATLSGQNLVRSLTKSPMVLAKAFDGCGPSKIDRKVRESGENGRRRSPLMKASDDDGRRGFKASKFGRKSPRNRPKRSDRQGPPRGPKIDAKFDPILAMGLAKTSRGDKPSKLQEFGQTGP